MTRILQIRRGTAAQNDNFTGLAGEITMDTTNKTVRIHDGSTQGGFALARQSDDIPETEPFDINSVSAEFWTALFETYQTTPATIQSENSVEMPILSVPYYDNTFTSSVMPMVADSYLVCQTPEAGYSIGDKVRAFGIGDYAYPHMNTYIQSGAVHTRLFTNNQSFWVFHKTDGTKTNITANKWKLKMTIYY